MIKQSMLALACACSVPAMAEITISGSAEMDLMFGTNRPKGSSGETTTQMYEEIALMINVDGRDKLDNGDTLSWRLAQKVQTDWKYDSWGMREAWIGYEGSWGSLRFGNQFTDTYLTMDWPYGTNGAGNMMGDTGAFATWTGRQGDGLGGSIRYASPSFSGINLTGQYILGSYGTDGSLGNGIDATVNGSWGGFTLNLGYQELFNRAYQSDDFSNGPVTEFNEQREGDSTKMYYIGARYVMGDWNVRAMWRGQKIVAGGGSKSEQQNNWLIGGGYNWGKNSLNLSYQQYDDGEASQNGTSYDLDSGVQQVAGQWNYSLSKNSIFFVQGRYHWYDSPDSHHFDGSVQSASNSMRLTVGTWTGF